MSVSPSDWVKGITLSVVATIIGGASKLAIRKSWLIEESLSESQQVYEGDMIVRNASDESSNSDGQTIIHTDEIRAKTTAFCLRLSGMVGMTVLNPFCGVLAMNYASPSITAPFSGLTLVWIVIFSDMLIGERPSFMQIIAATLIVLGEVVVAIFGDHTNDGETTLADLESSYREPGFVAFLVGITLWMALLLYWMRFSTSAVVKRFAWGVSGGSMTGIQNFMKDSLTILKAHEGIPWYFPVCLVLAIGMAFGGLLCLTGCMKRYDVTYSSSIFVGAYVVCASIMSATHYHTFENLKSVVNYLLYPCGLLILMAGVWILVKEAEQQSVQEQIRTPSVSKSTIYLVCWFANNRC
jgi:drug/metabolite transporter (DMT)-like permease